jgi:hypothetical protein
MYITLLYLENARVANTPLTKAFWDEVVLNVGSVVGAMVSSFIGALVGSVLGVFVG